MKLTRFTSGGLAFILYKVLQKNCAPFCGCCGGAIALFPSSMIFNLDLETLLRQSEKWLLIYCTLKTNDGDIRRLKSGAWAI